MDKTRLTSQLRVWFAAGGPLAALIINETGVSPDRYNLWVTAAIAVVPTLAAGVWDWRSNRQSARIKATSELPGVAKVVVTDTVNGAVGTMARSEDHPNVITETQNRSDIVGDWQVGR